MEEIRKDYVPLIFFSLRGSVVSRCDRRGGGGKGRKSAGVAAAAVPPKGQAVQLRCCASLLFSV